MSMYTGSFAVSMYTGRNL